MFSKIGHAISTTQNIFKNKNKHRSRTRTTSEPEETGNKKGEWEGNLNTKYIMYIYEHVMIKKITL